MVDLLKVIHLGFFAAGISAIIGAFASIFLFVIIVVTESLGALLGADVYQIDIKFFIFVIIFFALIGFISGVIEATSSKS